MKGLTKRQEEILRYIEDFIQSNHYSPSYREIMHYFNLKSLATVHKHLEVLKRKGVILSEKKCSRSLFPTKELHHKNVSIEVELPLIGHISAGTPVETFEHAQTLAVPEFLVHDPEKTYVLRARGNSLNDELIADGDLVIVEARQEASSGETVVALINHQNTTVKRYHPEGNYIRLISQTSPHHPLIVRNSDVTIQGVVIGVLRLM
jgi:repressor LexA